MTIDSGNITHINILEISLDIAINTVYNLFSPGC